MAASGTAVTVLTPNGRRQTIKVSPNTPLLQVLEDVCKKHGFNPDDHGLKFQRTVVDLTVPWRFANLPNNAKLEMVTSTRKQAAVADSQVCGEEALKKATLKSLGLTGGSAIVFTQKNKPPGEEDGREAAETAVVPTTPVAKETTPSPSPQPDPAPSHPETQTDVPVKNSSPGSPMETLCALSPASATGTHTHTATQLEEVSIPQDAVRPKVPPVERGAPEEDGEEAGPSGLSSHQSSSSSAAPSAPFIPFSGGGQRLGGPGGGAVGRSLSSSSSLSALTASVESPKAKKAKSSHGSNAKRQAPSNQPDEDMDHGEEFLEPVEREPLIYHLDSRSHQSKDHGDLPDEFFEITVDDVRKRFAQLKSERKLLEEAPLMTKSLREAQMKEKMDRYPKVVLRVQFPDRHILQGFFRPLETVGAVKQFVRSHLEDPQLSFYLFITPPKTILDDPTATLFQADLFPGALVYFGSDVKTDLYVTHCMPWSSTPSSSSVASEEPLPPPEQTADTSGSTQDEQDPSARTQAAKPTRSEPGKVPKWLKLPGKK
ncbi:hypothetical protein INR49_026492 [Caranx melampygus]|nr:hypothetical protein INR49_026492 [Caranx melampygus]